MIDIASIAFNQPWCIREQIRLFKKHLLDDNTLTVYDNSTDKQARTAIRDLCRASGTRYVVPATSRNEHDEALNFAAEDLLNRQAPYIGFVDHDIFPSEPVSLIPMLNQVGFLCIGQRHSPTNSLYGWPGWLWFKRSWLDDKGKIDFGGIRGDEKKYDGDCGSGNAHLWVDGDWERLFSLGLKHGYEPIRQPDSCGSQSWAVEWIADTWLHLTNASKWMAVPEPHEREARVREKVAAL